ncbi:MAG: hypothetical protein HY695_02305 [Deltaproteobacteria bacterium]|nr:hypothetical protein [Deltaproteobacteria bacterium]
MIESLSVVGVQNSPHSDSVFEPPYLHTPVEPVEKNGLSETTLTVGLEEAPKSFFQLWEKEDFGFRDFLDIINPLQHLPLISTLYRAFTDDKIGPVPRILGAALYGRISGIPGVISSVFNAIVGVFTGRDIGEHAYAMIFGDPHAPKNRSQVAYGALRTEPLAAYDNEKLESRSSVNPSVAFALDNASRLPASFSGKHHGVQLSEAGESSRPYEPSTAERLTAIEAYERMAYPLWNRLAYGSRKTKKTGDFHTHGDGL